MLPCQQQDEDTESSNISNSHTPLASFTPLGTGKSTIFFECTYHPILFFSLVTADNAFNPYRALATLGHTRLKSSHGLQIQPPRKRKVFIIDRSGSMSSHTSTSTSAPSAPTTLFSGTNLAHSPTTLRRSPKHCDRIRADFGGTEILPVIERRLHDLNLKILGHQRTKKRKCLR